MAKTFTTKVQNIFVPEPREVLEVLKPGAYERKDGTKSACAALALAGPKGGQFHLFMPDWYYHQEGQYIKPGQGFSGGWRDGQFVEPQVWADPEAEQEA